MADELLDLKVKNTLLTKELEDAKIENYTYKSLLEKMGYVLVAILGTFAIIWILFK